jgi:hypothetical protein
MHAVDLKTVVDLALRRLPMPHAPDTLLPRVLLAVEAWKRRPWYARAWFTWPHAWQAAAVAASMFVIAGVATWLGGAQTVSTLAFVVTSEVADVARVAAVTLNAALVVWSVLMEPFVAYVVALVVLMAAACAALGMALTHVALGGTVHS